MFALTLVFAVLIPFIKDKGRGRPKESQVCLISECVTGKLSNSARGDVWYQGPDG